MATKKIIMPQLGESVTEGTINSWLVKIGDYVQKYDPIADIMTDKVNAEVPSSYTGTIKEIIVNEGETVDVGAVICYIETDQENQNDEEKTVKTENEQDQKSNSGVKPMKNRYSPAVLKLAQENDLDLSVIHGTGRGGRITRKDVEKIIASGIQPSIQSHKDLTEHPPADTTSPATVNGVEIPVTGVRKVIAQNMVRAKQEIPHAWMTVEVDVTDLVSFRNEVKEEFKQREGFNLTYFAFFVKAVSQALKKYPQINSTWAGDKIIQHKDINISIAVAKDDELFVPVIKNADEKSIKGIAKEIYELAMKARSGGLTAQDMEGGTFTVNNTGSFGSVQSMGIINYPQAAILQVESIVKRPVIINDMFAARDIVNLCLSLDHRVLDGLICGKFLAEIKDLLENSQRTLTNVY